jgi:hypothetical protein
MTVVPCKSNEDNARISAAHASEYHVTADLVNQAIDAFKTQQTTAPG